MGPMCIWGWDHLVVTAGYDLLWLLWPALEMFCSQYGSRKLMTLGTSVKQAYHWLSSKVEFWCLSESKDAGSLAYCGCIEGILGVGSSIAMSVAIDVFAPQKGTAHAVLKGHKQTCKVSSRIRLNSR